MWSAMRAAARRWMTKIVVHPTQISRRLLQASFADGCVVTLGERFDKVSRGVPSGNEIEVAGARVRVRAGTLHRPRADAAFMSRAELSSTACGSRWTPPQSHGRIGRGRQR